MNTKTWVVAHDFSSCADAAAALAVRDLTGGREPATLLLVHIFQVPIPLGMEGFPIVQNITDIEGSLRSNALSQLGEVQKKLQAQAKAVAGAPEIKIEVVVQAGLPHLDIVDTAVMRKAERIIVGTHGRRGLGRVFLGSVAERVLRASPLPVMVVHDDAKA